MSSTFGSVGVAMVTPFHEDGSVDLATARKLARYLVDSGVDCVLCSGTTGESPTTHQPEKNALVETVVDEVGDEAFVMAGAGSNDTAHAVRMARGAAESGAHGLLVVTPYYSRPSQEGIYQHMTAVADASDLPVMLYDIPGRTGVKIAEDTFDRLAEHPRIKAVKDAVGSVPAGMATARRTGLEYYSGDDDLNLAWLSAGASGVISVVGHIAGSTYRQMFDAIERGDLETARQCDEVVHPIVTAIMGGGQGAVMAKEALKLRGIIPSAKLRLPLVGASDAEREALAAVLEAHAPQS